MKADLKALISKICSWIKAFQGDASWNSVNNYLYYKCVGDNVTIYGASSGSVILIPGTWNNIGALPDGYRPSRDLYFVVALRGTVQCTMGTVRTTGVVALYNDSASNQGYWVYNTTFPL